MPETLLPRDHIEAEARRVMAALAVLEVRGWDRQAERAKLILELNDLLDEWLLAQ
jgi:hypothetical protein